MPIYEYYCKPCRVQVEDFQRMSKMKKVINCPRCGRLISRIMSRLGFVEGNVTPKFYQ